MHTKMVEAKIYDGMCGFGGISVVPVFGIQLIACICLNCIDIILTNATITDQQAIRFQCYRQLKLDARALLLMAEKPTHEFLHAFAFLDDEYLAKNPYGYCGLGGTGVSCPIGTGIKLTQGAPA